MAGRAPSGFVPSALLIIPPHCLLSDGGCLPPSWILLSSPLDEEEVDECRRKGAWVLPLCPSARSISDILVSKPPSAADWKIRQEWLEYRLEYGCRYRVGRGGAPGGMGADPSLENFGARVEKSRYIRFDVINPTWPLSNCGARAQKNKKKTHTQLGARGSAASNAPLQRDARNARKKNSYLIAVEVVNDNRKHRLSELIRVVELLHAIG
mmetsp:Transcript_29542/g.57829  ORF Transcript_29542/g.57829 Transcript_29542/m.57829 type:complete len:210 (+) Transcript_29542:94-723(+)